MSESQNLKFPIFVKFSESYREEFGELIDDVFKLNSIQKLKNFLTDILCRDEEELDKYLKEDIKNNPKQSLSKYYDLEVVSPTTNCTTW